MDFPCVMEGTPGAADGVRESLFQGDVTKEDSVYAGSDGSEDPEGQHACIRLVISRCFLDYEKMKKKNLLSPDLPK